MAGITLTIDDRAVRQQLGDLIKAIANPALALREIGEDLTRTTKDRFDPGQKKAPDGTPWARNSQVTIARKGRDNPLYQRGTLQGQIHHEVSPDGRVLYVGTNTKYAATHQFGAKMGQYGRYSQVSRWRKFAEGDFRKYAGTQKGFPIPWGDIPARPFLGLSDQDASDAERVLRKYLTEAVG